MAELNLLGKNALKAPQGVLGVKTLTANKNSHSRLVNDNLMKAGFFALMLAKLRFFYPKRVSSYLRKLDRREQSPLLNLDGSGELKYSLQESDESWFAN